MKFPALAPPPSATAAGGFLLALILLAGPLPMMNAQDTPNPAAEIDAALKREDYTEVIRLTETLEENSPLERYRAAAFHLRGVENYFAGKVKESIADFDASLELQPHRDPEHWQRGIAYYHAGEYQKGKAQFERHQTVNPQDVENAVFHFICAVRAPGGSVAEARKNFIKIDRDTRVPMKQIHALYAGKGTADEVVAAAEADTSSPETLRNHLMYAHLYLGLYFEALGDDEKSAEHIRLAAGKYRMDTYRGRTHYMGKVAQVHAKLRNLDVEAGDDAETDKPKESN